ncbi:HIT family protein [Motilimonas sp. 1_MG-2023]|uniref:HIT domain-containing protein n=1 Tax=Motilimonas sp. 1_MG-2023 TaxID=3062672 RepID=UPI0026E301AA|nr:HIT family protein [Motilimonas sp. 1_MG-2023]MDO6526994.1 HIT family protein [Motilimonas sp. 1_MG-2023]
MQNFKLDSRLAQDCEFIAESPQSVLLLSKNAAYPWFILVPKTIYTELYQLDFALQQQLLKQINQVSQFMQAEFAPDKLNVAAIGNVVKQLHIHLVARFEVDPSWPGVVWGASANQAYSVQQLASIKQAAKQVLGAVFTFE